jgi:hypothetical protein
MTRNGKIARLPRKVREELNRRMRDGEGGKSLMEWLHSVPEVLDFVKTHCQGHGISRSNLSQWRLGGYLEWLAKEEILEQVREMAQAAEELQPAGAGKLSDQLALQLTARLFQALSEWDRNPEAEPSPKMKALRQLTRQVVALRRGDHSAARLKLAQDQVDGERKQTEAEQEATFWQRVKAEPGLWQRLQREEQEDDEKWTRLRMRVFGSAPK